MKKLSLSQLAKLTEEKREEKNSKASRHEAPDGRANVKYREFMCTYSASSNIVQ